MPLIPGAVGFEPPHRGLNTARLDGVTHANKIEQRKAAAPAETLAGEGLREAPGEL